MKQLGVIILLILTGITCSSSIQSRSYSSGGTASVLQAHQVVNTLTAYQAEQFTVSLSIYNVYGFDDVYDVTMNAKIPQEVELLSSSEPDLNSRIENLTDEFDYYFGTMSIDEIFYFSAIYNVTSAETRSIVIPIVNVSFRLENGITGFSLSNQEEIGLRGKRLTTTTELLIPIPEGELTMIDLGLIKIPAIPILSITGYLLPILFFSMSTIVLRRIR